MCVCVYFFVCKQFIIRDLHMCVLCGTPSTTVFCGSFGVFIMCKDVTTSIPVVVYMLNVVAFLCQYISIYVTVSMLCHCV